MYHQNPEAFVAESSKFGPIGMALVQLSNLEFAHDCFILSYYKNNEELSLSISKNFPRQFREKVDFLISAIANFSILLKIPMFSDGALDLIWLQYQLDELYKVRSKLAHGSIFLTKTHDNGTTWRFDSVETPEKRKWVVTSTYISSTFLADTVKTARGLKQYLNHLKMGIEGEYTWEQTYKTDCEIRGNHRSYQEMVEFGAYPPSDLITSMMKYYEQNL